MSAVFAPHSSVPTTLLTASSVPALLVSDKSEYPTVTASFVHRSVRHYFIPSQKPQHRTQAKRHPYITLTLTHPSISHLPNTQIHRHQNIHFNPGIRQNTPLHYLALPFHSVQSLSLPFHPAKVVLFILPRAILPRKNKLTI